jgi:hypothetical protein
VITCEENRKPLTQKSLRQKVKGKKIPQSVKSRADGKVERKNKLNEFRNVKYAGNAGEQIVIGSTEQRHSAR